MPERRKRGREAAEDEDDAKKKAKVAEEERRVYFERRRAEHLARSRRRYLPVPRPPRTPSVTNSRLLQRQEFPLKQRFIGDSFSYKYEDVAAAPFLRQGTVPLIVETFGRDIFYKKTDFYRSLDTVAPSFCRSVEGFFVEQRAYIIRWCILLIRARYRWRRLAHAFLWRRANRTPLDMVDAITLDPIRQPVIVYDMKNRCRHQFDAQSLLHHIVSQLLHHTSGFPEATVPRNPLTNIPFTYAQLVSIYGQLRAHGRIHWAFAAYAAAQFRINALISLHEPALRLTSIRNYVFRDYEGTVDELVDFIYLWAEHHGITIIGNRLTRLEHALSVIPSHTYLMCWRRLYMRALAANIVHYPTPRTSDTPVIAVQRRSILIYSRILAKNIFVFLNEAPKPPPPDLFAIIMGYGDDDEDDEEEDEDDY
jgi:hypothetical protein